MAQMSLNNEPPVLNVTFKTSPVSPRDFSFSFVSFLFTLHKLLSLSCGIRCVGVVEIAQKRDISMIK